MKMDQPVTKEYFVKRLVDLCLKSGLSGFPKDEVDQHILLKSAVLTLGKSESFTEKEIAEKLNYWINQVSQIQKMDHATLRRWLIDTGYLTRAKDGSSYQVAPSGARLPQFDEAIDQLDIPVVIQSAREDIARRKQAYLEKSGSPANKK